MNKNYLVSAVFGLTVAIATFNSVAVPNQKSSTASDPCAIRNLTGNIPSSVHVVYQMHADTDTMRAREQAIFSGLQTYKILRTLISQGVSTILLEGVEEKVNFADTYESSQLKTLMDSYHHCVNQLSPSKSPLFAEEYCLAASLYRSYPTPYILLEPVRLIGFENQAQYQRSLQLSQKYFTHENDAHAKHEFKEHVDRERSRIAVNAALNYAQHEKNVAVVIGEGHKISLEDYLQQIPSQRRPTFHFYDAVGCNSLVSIDRKSIQRLIGIISSLE